MSIDAVDTNGERLSVGKITLEEGRELLGKFGIEVRDQIAYDLTGDVVDYTLPAHVPLHDATVVTYVLRDVLGMDDAEVVPEVNGAEYAFENGHLCPMCSSDNIEGDSIEVDEGSAWQEIRCLECGFEYRDIYELTSYEAGS